MGGLRGGCVGDWVGAGVGSVGGGVRSFRACDFKKVTCQTS